MSWVSILAIFVIVWWLALFLTLPFGIQKIENPEAGHDRGAPARPRLVIKALVTTPIAALVTAGIWAAIEYKWIDFRGPPA
jgi:predicted secreted protein